MQSNNSPFTGAFFGYACPPLNIYVLILIAVFMIFASCLAANSHENSEKSIFLFCSKPKMYEFFLKSMAICNDQYLTHCRLRESINALANCSNGISNASEGFAQHIDAILDGMLLKKMEVDPRHIIYRSLTLMIERSEGDVLLQEHHPFGAAVAKLFASQGDADESIVRDKVDEFILCFSAIDDFESPVSQLIASKSMKDCISFVGEGEHEH